MLTIANGELEVRVLDPVTDRAKLGSRYCTGGYIWQVTDHNGNDLFRGPQYPASNPSPFNGQGLPEAFETAIGHEQATRGGEVLVIGVGSVLCTSPITPFHVRDNPTVSEFCAWDVDQQRSYITMQTHQTFRDWSFQLTRRIELTDRTICSSSRIVNPSGEGVAVRWFAHPFFPLNADLSCCKFSVPVDIPLPNGFSLADDNYVMMSPQYAWSKGCYRKLTFGTGSPVQVLQRHPLLDEIKVDCEFPVADCPIWANEATFSFEPYFESIVPAGAEANWSIRYNFGKPRTRM